jgi:hypothetical protein
MCTPEYVVVSAECEANPEAANHKRNYLKSWHHFLFLRRKCKRQSCTIRLRFCNAGCSDDIKRHGDQ